MVFQFEVYEWHKSNFEIFFGFLNFYYKIVLEKNSERSNPAFLSAFAFAFLFIIFKAISEQRRISDFLQRGFKKKSTFCQFFLVDQKGFLRNFLGKNRSKCRYAVS